MRRKTASFETGLSNTKRGPNKSTNINSNFLETAQGMNRITAIVGAGAILDFDLPHSAIVPNTKNITTEILNLSLSHPLTHCLISELIEVYHELKKCYVEEPNFEVIIHVLEMWYAYCDSWNIGQYPLSNKDMFPPFAPFVRPRYCFDKESIRIAIQKSILRIIEIVDEYNTLFRQRTKTYKWYRKFWKGYNGSWDIFNLNYDTTIEQCFKTYEDGFEKHSKNCEFLTFNPKRLIENEKKRSTINHLHGCIEYYSEPSPCGDKSLEREYDSHDLFKYQSPERVFKLLENTVKSSVPSQQGEQLIDSPIITGLKKLDKISIIPCDFYHCHLLDCIVKNRSMLIVGYSFGDYYINNAIERMKLIHHKNMRIVLIDKWEIKGTNSLKNITDKEKRSKELKSLIRGLSYDNTFSTSLQTFLLRSTNQTNLEDALTCFNNYDLSGPMISCNKCLMLFIGGFKEATNHNNEIYNFLNS